MIVHMFDVSVLEIEGVLTLCERICTCNNSFCGLYITTVGFSCDFIGVIRATECLSS